MPWRPLQGVGYNYFFNPFWCCSFEIKLVHNAINGNWPIYQQDLFFPTATRYNCSIWNAKSNRLCVPKVKAKYKPFSWRVLIVKRFAWAMAQWTHLDFIHFYVLAFTESLICFLFLTGYFLVSLLCFCSWWFR